MTIKPDPKNKEPAAQKPAPKPVIQSGAKPGSAPSGPDRELAARDMKRGLGGGGGFLWALLALALVAGAGAATMDAWMPKLAGAITAYQTPRVDPRLAPVAERVQTLEKKLQAQAQAQARTPPPPVADMREIVRRLTKMETRLAELRKMVGATRPPEAALIAGQSLQRLSGRLQSLERNRKEVDAILKRIAVTDRSLPGDKKKKQETEAVTGGRELVTAARELNRRIKSDKPFADVLAQVKRLAGDDKDMAVNIAVLEPLARSGIGTMDQLRRQFTAVAAAVRRAKPLPAEPLRAGTGWWDKTVNKLAAMVSLRRQGKKEEKNAALERARPQLLAAAEKALGENNVSTAITVLEGLRDLPEAAAWIGRARGRETAKKAAAALNLFALTRLARLVEAAAVKAPEITTTPEKATPEETVPKKAPPKKTPPKKAPPKKAKE